MSKPPIVVTKSNTLQMAGAFLAVALVAAGITFGLTRDDSSSSFVTVDQIRNVARVSTIEYHVSEFLREKLPRGEWIFKGTVEGAVYMSAVITGSVDIQDVEINLDDSREPPRATITIPKGAVHISDPEVCPDCVEFIKLNVPITRVAISDTEWTAIEAKALETIKNEALDDGIECRTAARLATVMEAFLEPFGYETEVVFEDSFNLGACSSST